MAVDASSPAAEATAAALLATSKSASSSTPSNALPEKTTPTDDSITARISPACPDDVRLLLQTAWARDLSGVKPLLGEPGNASLQDPVTKETPLHAAIRGCGPRVPPKDGAIAAKASTDEKSTEGGNADSDSDDDPDAFIASEAADVVRELFCWGAIWNDVDDHNETPGCVAQRLGRRKLYDLCVDAGVRAELLFGLMGGYEELGSEGDDVEMLEGWEGDDEEVPEEAQAGGDEDGDEAPQLTDTAAVASAESSTDAPADTPAEAAPDVPADASTPDASAPAEAPPPTDDPSDPSDPPVTSGRYLASSLTLAPGALLDADRNGVMMAWETPIMARTVDALLGTPPARGRRILNIGFGMGIVDGMFAAAAPARHHIIEAHPDVLARVANDPEAAADVSLFGAAWEASGPADGAFKMHAGRWQDVVPALAAAGEVYDVIYFDTFGEDYAQLRAFFTEHLPALLDMPDGVFGYFNGCGADRQICYDVYARVAEAHLAEAGMDVEWVDVDVEEAVGADGRAGEGEWAGVRRRYWTLEKYRMPVCTWMG